MGIIAMSTNWIFSSTFLPYIGEPIDFQLEDRGNPIHGTFVDGAFHSRWANYDADRVQSWRPAIADPAREGIIEARFEKRRVWFTPFSRLARLFQAGADEAAPAPTARSHSRSVVRPVFSAAAECKGTKKRYDSNQMSS